VANRLVSALRASAAAPAVHFALLGALLFALTSRTATSLVAAPLRKPIVITAARIAEIRDDYARVIGGAPTADDVAALVAREADDEMLYREALLLGLDRGDRSVEYRVVEKMRFLYGEEAGDNAQAYRRGLALGLERDDVVVRSALITKMRLLAKAASQAAAPTGEALERALAEYLRRHAARYVPPVQLSLTHVFLDASRRGSAVASDARDFGRRLREQGIRPDAAPASGDAFAAGHVLRRVSPNTLRKLFGDAFAEAVAALEPEQWSMPIRSPYGLHLVWVSERDAGELPPLAAVRSRVLRAYRAERQAEYVARMIAQLRTAYEVRIEDTEAQGG